MAKKTKMTMGVAVDQIVVGAAAAVLVAVVSVADYSLLVNVMGTLAGSMAPAAAMGVVAAAVLAGIDKEHGKLGVMLLAMLLGLEAMLAVLRELAMHAQAVQAAIDAAAAHAKDASAAAKGSMDLASIGLHPKTMGAAIGAAGDAAVKLLQAQTDIADRAGAKAAAEIPFSYLGTAAMAVGSMLMSLAIKIGTGKAMGAVTGARLVVEHLLNAAPAKKAKRKSTKKAQSKGAVVQLKPRPVPAYGGMMSAGMKVR